MSDIISIPDLRKNFAAEKTLEDWQQFAEHQMQVIGAYAKELEVLRLKNRQLETMLSSKIDMATEISSEEIICIQQIEMLESSSAQRQLTLDEVKRLDLLVKNLKLIREQSTIVVNSNPAEKLAEADLVALATRKTE